MGLEAHSCKEHCNCKYQQNGVVQLCVFCLPDFQNDFNLILYFYFTAKNLDFEALTLTPAKNLDFEALTLMKAIESLARTVPN
jgi:hypothetical protein